MVTRFYLANSGVPCISPACDGSWTSSANADRRRIHTSKQSTTLTSVARNCLAGGGTEYVCTRQYISDPLAAQTIAGHVKGQIRCAESNSANSSTLMVSIRVVSQDGSTVRGTLLALTGSDLNTTTPPEFYVTTLYNRPLQDVNENTSIDLSSLDIQSGDRLVIELGFSEQTTTTSRTGSLNFGDGAASDLPEDSSTTAAQNPWIEFDSDLVFLGRFGELLYKASTNNVPTGYVFGCNFTATEDGNLTHIDAILWLTTAGNIKAALYATSGDAPASKIAESAAKAVGTTAGWVEFAVSAAITANTKYSFQFIANQEQNYNYAAGASNQQPYASGQTYPTFPDPYPSPSYNAFDQCVFGIYTTSGVSTKTKTYTIDSLLQKLGVTKTYTVDGYLTQKGKTKTYTIDAILKLIRTKTYTLDALLEALGKVKTYTVDGMVQAKGKTKTYSIDAYLVHQGTKTYTVDAYLKVLNKTATYTIDAIIGSIATRTVTYTIDAMLKRLAATKTYTLDAFLARLNRTKTYTVDGVLISRRTKTYSVDGYIERLGATLSYTIDAIVGTYTPPPPSAGHGGGYVLRQMVQEPELPLPRDVLELVMELLALELGA